MAQTNRFIRFLLVSLLGLLFISASPTQEAAAKRLSANPGTAYDLIAAVNALRAANGLPAYTINNSLMAAAQGHSDYQASIGSITHTGAGGSSAKGRAISAGYGGGATVFVSENIAGGTSMTYQSAVSMWQGDDLHLNTMLGSSYTDVGAGVASDGNAVYFTLDVGYIAGSPGSGSSTSAPGIPAATAVAYLPVQKATPQADGSIIHTVQAGQTLWTISAIYEVPLDRLLQLNQMTNGSWIHPGDEILVAPPEEKPTAPQPTLTERPIPTRLPTSTPQPQNTPSPLVTLQAVPEEPQPQTNGVDKVLPLLIGALVIFGAALLIAGNLLKRYV